MYFGGIFLLDLGIEYDRYETQDHIAHLVGKYEVAIVQAVIQHGVKYRYKKANEDHYTPGATI